MGSPTAFVLVSMINSKINMIKSHPMQGLFNFRRCRGKQYLTGSKKGSKKVILQVHIRKNMQINFN